MYLIMTRLRKIFLRWKPVILINVIVVAGAASLVGSFYAGYSYGLDQPKIVRLEGLQNVEPPSGTAENVDFNIFWQAWEIIKNKTLTGKDAKDIDLVYGSIRGLVNSLNDPHSVFFPPEDSKKFEDDIKGEFGGVGMEIGKKNGNLVVIAPLKNTPAEKAGLKPQDKILKVDDTFTNDLDVDQAVKIIRGPAGSEVKLLILRDSWEEPKEFKVTRATISIPTLDLEMKGDIAVVRLYNFNSQAPEKFYDAMVRAAQNKATGIVLDLRNNPGGFLEVAVHLAGWFLEPNKLVVGEQYRSGERDEFKSNGNGALKNIPVVVLVNEGSASASEILAGALRDQRKIKLVGEKTFGKGTVQTLEKLTDGSTLKITVANWVLPSGLIIEKNGLEPDVKVKLTEEDAKNGRDPQLDKALEILKAELSK